jgi:hypothetical protein
MNNSQEKMDTGIGSSQEQMRTAIFSIRTELEETMKQWVESALSALDHRAQGTQAKIKVSKDQVDTVRRGLEAK